MAIDIKFDEWDTIIRDGVAPFDIRLTEEQVQLFYLHARELVQWTQTVNLTAITDPREVAIKHFVDSLCPLTHLTPMKKVLDVGSGGGFPGLPLKVLHPEIELTLIDAVRKKTSFMQHVIRKMKMKGAKAVHSRLENLHDRGDAFTSFDTIVCRAFSDLSFIIPHVLPLLTPDGKIIVWKGRIPEKEITDFKDRYPDHASTLTMKIYSYRLPIVDAERNIVRITTLNHTSEKLKQA